MPTWACVCRKTPQVCDEVYEKAGVVMMIVDANELNMELLGKGNQLEDWAAALEMAQRRAFAASKEPTLAQAPQIGATSNFRKQT